MNRRILKKLSKKAVAVLLEKHSFNKKNITVADGSETIDAPLKFPRRQQQNGFASPLKGTPMVWEQTSYECNEWDCQTAHDVLSNVEYWMTITQWDENGVATITKHKPFTEAYPGQIEDMISGIESGLPAQLAPDVYKHPIPNER